MGGVGRKQDDATMQRLYNEITNGFDGVKQRVHRLQGVIDELETGGQWRGVGANAFNAKQVEINERLIHMGRTLVKFLDAMDQTTKIKLGTEDEIRAAVQSIDVQDGGAHHAPPPPPTSNISGIPA